MADICKHCGAPVREINYALGPEWMHVDPDAPFPTEYKGTAWRICKGSTVATPKEGRSDGRTRR